jgi:hypothetical protein
MFLFFFYQRSRLLMTDSVPCQSLAGLYVNKRRSKKMAPRCPGPSDCLALLVVAGTLKNSSA